MITGAIGQGKNGCDVEIHTFRDRQTALGPNDNLLLHATESGHANDAITRSKATDVAADLKHLARDFATWSKGEIRFDLVLTADHQDIWKINAAGANPHPQFPRAWGTAVDLLQSKYIWLAVFATKQGFHAGRRIIGSAPLQSHFPPDRPLAATTMVGFAS